VIHKVQPGENLYRLSLKYNVTVNDLKSWNKLTSDAISSGQILRVSIQTVIETKQPTTEVELRQKQMEFWRDIGAFIVFASQNGFQMTFGEFWRTPYQQAEHFRTGASKTMNSLHLIRLAGDFNIWKNGRQLFAKGISNEQYLIDLEEAKPLGVFWMSLSPDNVWGGDWNRNFNFLDEKFRDPYHFEKKQ